MDRSPPFPAVVADRYVIERELGRGGMATVYLARDRRHDRLVAVKVLHSDLVSSMGAERFVREIQIASHLTHPHILPLLDSGECDGRPYYVMPYVAGESLRARLTRLGSFTVDEALRIAIAVAQSLEHAHQLGVVHRDIKPENVLLVDEEPVVTDFGIARAVREAAGDEITIAGVAVGTPTYMSPEQAAGDRSVDGRTDVYSLGVMLYELLTGDPPFTGSSIQEISARKVSLPPPSLRLACPAASRALGAAVRRSLSPVPADRFPSAREFADALTVLRRDAGTRRRTPVPLREIVRRAARGATSWRTVALAGMAASAVFLFHTTGGREARVLQFDLPTGLLPVTGHDPAPVVAISPTGGLVAYVAGSGGSGQLYLRRLDSAAAVPVAHALNVQAPFFSPDGQWLGFVDVSRGVTDAVLKRIRLADGAQFTICPVREMHGAAWLPDGRIVLGGMTTNGGGLSIVSADGGRPESLIAPDRGRRETDLVYPTALPDGHAVLFNAQGGADHTISVNVVEIDSRRRTQVMAGGGYAVALSEGVLVYAAHGAIFAAPFDLAGRRLTGRAERLLTDVLMTLPTEPSLGHFALSRDGTLAYLAGDAGSIAGHDAAGQVDTAAAQHLSVIVHWDVLLRRALAP